MKAKVRLSYTVELMVEGESEDSIYEWMSCTTPSEALDMACRNRKMIYEDYDEEFICSLPEDSDVDVVI